MQDKNESQKSLSFEDSFPVWHFEFNFLCRACRGTMNLPHPPKNNCKGKKK